MRNQLFTLICAFLLSGALSAQSVDDVVTKYQEAAGGVDKWRKLTSMRTTGKANQMGMEFPFSMVQARPNRQKLEVDIQGMKYVEAFDGTTAWTINPFAGGTAPTKKSAEEAAEQAKQMFEDDLMDYASKGHKASLEGKETVEGMETLVIKLTTKDGDDRFYYMDPDNYVPIKVKSYASAGQMKGMAVEQYMSDYQEVDGIMMPFSMTTKVSGQVVASLTFDRIETNVPVKDQDFAFPSK